MQTITIDLTKDPEVAALLADKEPGAKVYACFSLKSRDEQTAVLRIKEMADTAAELPKADEYEDDEEAEEEIADEDADEVSEPPPSDTAKSRGARMASAMASGDGVMRM